MAHTVGDVYRMIDGFAPYERAEEWDNPGILAGSERTEVSAILCALELNPMVIEEAKALGANLIVTHHPILFRARRNLREDDPEGRTLCELVRAGIALIAVHTNFDAATPGVNDVLAEKLGLRDCAALESGMRVGTPAQRTLGEFRDMASAALGAPVRCYGRPESPIHRVAVLGGAGGDYAGEAKEAGADVYLTGEISHHRAWDAYLDGLNCLEAGHAATELPAVELLAEGLQKAADGVQWKVHIHVSRVELFR